MSINDLRDQLRECRAKNLKYYNLLLNIKGELMELIPALKGIESKDVLTKILFEIKNNFI